MTPKQQETLQAAIGDKVPFFWHWDGIKFDLHGTTVRHENGARRTKRFFRVWGSYREPAICRAEQIHANLKAMGGDCVNSPAAARGQYIRNMD
jgi:hypothetical protein